MTNASMPRPYPEWRPDPGDRAEDAAYVFGYYLIQHCRDEALATLPPNASPEARSAAENAVDVALHNVCDLLEGFWPLDAGPGRPIQLALHVNVMDKSERHPIESIPISPAGLDLPIGYWKWAQDRMFRSSR